MIRGLTLIPLAIVLCSCGRSASDHLARGRELAAKNQPAAALLEFRKAIQKDARLAAAHYELALAAGRTGDAATATNSLREAARLDPNHLDARQRLAELLVASAVARPQSAPSVLARVEELLAAVERDPRRAYDCQRFRAALALTAGRPEAALAALDRAAAVRPLSPDLLLIRYQALYRIGRREEAHDVARALMEADPLYPAIFPLFARHLAAQGDRLGATQVLQRHIARAPSDPSAQLNLASFLLLDNRPAEADRVALAMAAQHPRNPEILIAASRYWIARGASPTARKLLEQGLALGAPSQPRFLALLFDLDVASQDPDAARQRIEAALRAYPAEQPLLLRRASLLLASPRAPERAEGRAALLRLLSGDPSLTPLRLRLAASLDADGEPAAALDQFQEAVSHAPGSVEAQLALGRALLAARQPAPALERAQAALLLAPNLLAALDLKVGALSDLGRTAELRVTLNELRRLTPESPILSREFGWLALREGKAQDAEREFRRALAQNATDPRAFLGLVRSLAAQNRLSDALREIAQARRRQPDRPDLRLLEGEALASSGRLPEATLAFESLAAQFPQWAEPRKQLSTLAWTRGEGQRSLELLRQARPLAPADLDLLRLLGTRLDAAGLFSESVEVHRAALILEPGNPIVWNNLAYALAATRQSLDEAQRLARKAIAKVPGEPGLLDTLGFVLIQQNQTAEAVRLYATLTANHDGSAVYRYHYGLALLQSGSRSAALREFDQALQSQPAPALRNDIQQARLRAAS